YTNPSIIRAPNGMPYGISSMVGQEMSNPLAYQQTRAGNYGWSDNFVANAYVELEPLEGLKFRSTLGGKLSYWGGESFTPVYYLNSSNSTSQNNISRNTHKGFGWNIENTLSYDKIINKHHFNVLLGQGTYVDNISSGETVTYFDIPTNNYKEASFNYSVPKEQIDASAYTNPDHRVTSLFSRLNYNFDEKYIFTGIISCDGSSRFGVNNKYVLCHLFVIGWVLYKQDFWKESQVLNVFKLRGGYGVTGSDAIGDFRYLSTIGDGRNYSIGTAGSVTIGNSPNAPSNPDLKWEETTQTNIGFEARLLQNFSLVFDL